MIKINDVEILTVLDGVVWGGSKDSAIRTLDFKFLYNPIKPDIPKYLAKCGDRVEWTEDGQLLFYGYIEKLDYDTNQDVINIGCVDYLSRVKRSKCVGRFKGTLDELATKICAWFGLKNGLDLDDIDVSQYTHVHNIVSTGDKTYYDILKIACDTLFERYCLYLDGLTLRFATHKSQGTYAIGRNIRSSSFSQDISEIVTKVVIIDDKGNQLQTIPDDKLIEQFGVFQDVYSYNKDIKNNKAEAEKQIKKPVNKANIVCDNNNNCISGRFIKVLEPYVQNDMGFFEILTDSHSIGTDSSMQLEIKYIYDTKDTEGIENL